MYDYKKSGRRIAELRKIRGYPDGYGGNTGNVGGLSIIWREQDEGRKRDGAFGHGGTNRKTAPDEENAGQKYASRDAG